MKKLAFSLFIFCIAAVTTDVVAQSASDDTFGPKERKGRPDVPGTFLIELGWNNLLEAPASMDTKIFGSRTLNLIYFYDIQIGNSKFSFLPGIGVGLDRYSFDNNVTLSQGFDADNNLVVSVDTLTTDLDKSMLVSNYFDIPLEFRFHTNPSDKKRSFNVGVGFKGGVRFGSMTKIKYDDGSENVKEKDKKSFDLNRFRYGLTGRIGIGGFNFFYYHSLSELFDGNGPQGTDTTTNFTVGLSFKGF